MNTETGAGARAWVTPGGTGQPVLRTSYAPLCPAPRHCAGCGEPISGPARVLGMLSLCPRCPLPRQGVA
jgi:hypothetical protein